MPIPARGHAMTPPDDSGAPDEDAAMLARLEADPIGELCRLVKECGLTMTLYGKPVAGPEELREAALGHAIDRLARSVVGSACSKCGTPGGECGAPTPSVEGDE
jgi:hypothetical protein